MGIQWYPGHMEKAKRAMMEDIKLIDVVIEILDSRAPHSCLNPQIETLANGKEMLIILNKADLADENETAYWAEKFNEEGMKTLIINSKDRVGIKSIEGVIRELTAKKTERDRKRGIVNRPVRAMVAGIPNSGKSTFTNAYTKRAGAKTGNSPGVTRGKQWIRMGKNLELLDTPGILWPKIEEEAMGYNLALIGSINDNILDITDLSVYFIGVISAKGLNCLNDRYNITDLSDAHKVLEEIAVNTGAKKPGGETDTEKAARTLLDDFRSGRLGRITIDSRG
ncbi:MAG: ribosome biogenesis GTPase YlqF [Lachnospiraceae bacterium]|nr:ribosome biogenesis GTPase YlqF [Lachnospiraceae bacterium]